MRTFFAEEYVAKAGQIRRQICSETYLQNNMKNTQSNISDMRNNISNAQNCNKSNAQNSADNAGESKIKGDVPSKRLAGPDVVRFIASLFVVMAHFYLNCNYYNEPLVGGKMFIETFFRWLFIICVPLYMMLSGFFLKNRQPNKKHYMSILPLLISYLIVSVCKMLLYNRLYGEIYPFKEMLKNLGNYNIAWYMGMYICIIILSPLINKFWAALSDKKERHIAIISLLILCSVYPVFHYIAPSFMIGLYPVLYYLLGAYIRDNRPKINKLVLAGVIFTSVLIETLISYFGVHGGVFDWNLITQPDTGFGSIFVVAAAVSVFLMFYDVDIKNSRIKKLLAKIGGVSFEIYICAGAMDAIVYSYLKRTITSAVDFFWYFFLTVPVVYVSAVIIAIALREIINRVLKKQ